MSEETLATLGASEETFASLGASPAVISALAKRSIDAPFEIQTRVIADGIDGRDVLAKSRTGSGKTLAFAIPIVERLDPRGPRPSAVVLVPTRELASQMTEDFESLATAKGLRVAPVYGGVDIKRQANKASSAHILLATPGRLEDLCTRRLVDLKGVKILVLDEADRMLDMGFQPQVDRLVRRMPAERQTMFFSATLDGEVGRLATAYTKNAVFHEVQSLNPTVDLVEHRFVSVPQGDKVGALIDLLGGAKNKHVTLIFVRTKRGTERLVGRLKASGISAAAMHGDMTQPARQRSLAQFESGKVSTLVATDVAARGLDLDSISHVVNFDPPEDHKAYLHRVGRTARAGRSGIGITFVLPDQQTEVGRIASSLKLKDEFEKEGLKVGPPAIAYQSHRGRRSMMYRPGRRR